MSAPVVESVDGVASLSVNGNSVVTAVSSIDSPTLTTPMSMEPLGAVTDNTPPVLAIVFGSPSSGSASIIAVMVLSTVAPSFVEAVTEEFPDTRQSGCPPSTSVGGSAIASTIFPNSVITPPRRVMYLPATKALVAENGIK